MVAAAVVSRSRRGMALVIGSAVFAFARPAETDQADLSSRIAPAVDLSLRTLATDVGSITAIAPAGDSRLYLALRSGRILLWQPGRTPPTPFLDISKRVSCCGGRGLLSVAFHPEYASNGLFFVAYTDRAGNLVLARYRRSRKHADRALRSSRAVLLKIPFPAQANHHGGALQFGPDGYLYFGVGDGGSGSPCVAQRDNARLGKVLRLDVDARRERRPFYAIPRSNPSAGAASPADEVWAKGLRDPWRFSFDRRTGDLYIGDVGEKDREEIDFQPASSYGGENYGWSLAEGSICVDATTSGCPAPALPCDWTRLQPPVFEYGRTHGDCGVVGGYVYRGSRFPALSGLYLYGDYCSGRIRASGWLTGAVAPKITTFGEDAAGELYAGTETGMLYRVESTPTPAGRMTGMRRDPALPRPSIIRVPQPSEPRQPRPEPMETAPEPEVRLFWQPTPVPMPVAIEEPAEPPAIFVEPEPLPEPDLMAPQEEPPPAPTAAPPPAPTAAPTPIVPEREPPNVPPREQPTPRPVEPRK